MNYIFLVGFFIATVTSIIFPPPKYQNLSKDKYIKNINLCNIVSQISEKIKFDTQYYFQKISNRINFNKKCSKLSVSKQENIVFQVDYSQQLKQEGYKLLISSESIKIIVKDYSGFIYAMESLAQIMMNGNIPLGQVYDQPVVMYRGVMIDTSKHFIDTYYIEKLLKSMPLSKLNILHWHFSDDQFFSFNSRSHPQLPLYGGYNSSSVYSLSEITRLISIGKLNGVEIVPQFDTPAHFRSWGLSPSTSNLTIQCNKNKLKQQLDITKNQVYDLVRGLWKQIDSIFLNSPYLHFGGRDISEDCWSLKSSYKTFKLLHNLKTVQDVIMYWRYQIKSALPVTRKAIYWEDQSYPKLETSPMDIVQYIGSQANISSILGNKKSWIILSPSQYADIGAGRGNNQGRHPSNDKFVVWRQLYQKFVLFPQGIDRSRILGAEVLVWGDNTNEDTFENDIWMRAAALGSRLWSEQILPTSEIVKLLVGLQYRMYDLGIDASPITSQFCQNKPQVCFPQKLQELQILTD